jgi:hypothetical protein
MKKDTLALFLSLIALTLSIFYFLSFHAFRNSKLIYYDENKLLFNKKFTYSCDNIRDERTCRNLMSNSNMIKIENNDILLDKNTLICDNVNDIKTCECLSKSCDFYKFTSNIMFIDKPLAFTKEKFGKIYGARAIPTGLKDEFTFSTWINISFIDSPRWRSIFQWVSNTNDYDIRPGIYISPEEWSSCNAKIDIRFSNMNNNKLESINNNGIFNLIEGNHGHCVTDTKYYKWFHFLLVCKGTSVKYYIDGQLSQEEVLEKPIEVGNDNGYIYIGGSKDYSSEGLILSKTRWFSKALEQNEIEFISKEKYE